MPSVYNYRHVELDKVGRGKRVIQPPGGQTADIFGSRAAEPYSSASSQAGSDVASSRIHIETDQQSVSGQSMGSSQAAVDGMMRQAQATGGQVSPNGSVDSASAGGRVQQAGAGGQPLLMADDFKPVAGAEQQQMSSIQQQKMMQMQQQAAAAEANRTPKKTIPVLRRNPITGEILDNPSNRQQPVVRVRQPPGGRSSGIF